MHLVFRNKRMSLILLILFCTFGGIAAGQDYRNQTVECAFIQMNACLDRIAALGGNFSAAYAQSPAEMNRTCLSKGNFQMCILGVPQSCNALTSETLRKINGIGQFLERLCTNGTHEHDGFLNSSVCYNKNMQTRQRCVAKYPANGRDAKALCCRSKRIQECLQKDMERVCPRNATSFQNQLVGTYSVFTNTLCAPYFQLCNGAIAQALSVSCLLLTAKVALFTI